MQKKRKKKYLRNILGIVVSTVIFYFILKKLFVNYQQVKEAIYNANLFLILLGILFIFLGEMFVVLIWKEFMWRFYGKKLPFYQSLILMFLPNIARYIPGKVWFVFGIAYLAKEWQIDTVSALTVTLVTQLMILLSALLSGIIYIGFSGMYNLPYWIYFVFVLLVILLLQPKILHKLLCYLLKSIKKDYNLQKIPEMSVKVLLETLVFGMLLWTFIGIGITISGIAFYNNISMGDFRSIAGAFSTSYFIGYASIITPAGLGIREGAFALLLPNYLSNTQKLVFSVSSRIWMTIAEILIFVIGAILLRIKHIDKPEKIENDKGSSHSNSIPAQ